MAKERGTRKTRIGVVLSDKMDKTRVVGVEWSRKHQLYKRRVQRLTRFKAHDPENATRQGDTVRIMETRPLSRDKRWRIVEVVQRGQQVDLRPEDVDTSLLQEFGERPAEDSQPGLPPSSEEGRDEEAPESEPEEEKGQ